MNLEELFRGKTDKLDIHCYGPVYEELFADRRMDVKRFLEVGVRFGGSLRAWAEYFPNAEIWGIDNGAEGGPVSLDDGRIHVRYADETKPETAFKFFATGWQRFDIVVDDGHHHPYVQAAMFAMAWPYVEPGGVYVIEDVEDITYANQLASLFGGEVRDLRHVRGRHDSILVIFRKAK